MDTKHTILLWIYICFSLPDLSVLCSRALPHVSRYDVVRLQRLDVHGRAKRSAASQQPFPGELHFSIALEGTNYTLHLEKNSGLIGKDYTLTHYKEDGTITTTGTEATEHCYYHGHIPGVKNSSISVGLCSGMHGVVWVGQQAFHVEPLEGSVLGEHAVFRPQHLVRGGRRVRRGAAPRHDDFLYDNMPRPQGMRSHISLNAPRYVELVVVVDSSEYKHYKSKTNVQEFIMGVVNHVDKLYRKSLGVRVILVGLEVWSRDQITVTGNAHDLLYSFIEWRNKHLTHRKKHDNVQFVTGVDFEGSTVGLGFMSVMCFDNSGGVNQDRHDGIESLASTMAHEMGHNMGMSHDTTGCRCGASDNCVMAETVSNEDYPQYFSSCSVDQYRQFLGSNNPACLLNRPAPETFFGPPRCGNGLLESGEQCDCGTAQECTNPCCNATTCRLTEGSQCAEGECCQSCKFKSSRSMCRASAHDCDLSEYCSGHSAECPSDAYAMNGSPCNRNHGYCYNGQCPSRQQQCQLIFGEAASACPEKRCLRRYGCDEQQLVCGNVRCRGGKTKFNITFIEVDRNCKEITHVNSPDPHFNRAPTGTKCGHNMVCAKGRCQDVSVFGARDCAEKCNNHGVCNHENQCHCDPGWAPPFCTEELPNQVTGASAVVVGVCIAVAILILLTLVVAALSCCRNTNTHSKPTMNLRGRSGFRQTRTSSGQANPVFQAGSAKGSPRCGGPRSSPQSEPPRIGHPTLLESTHTQSCRALPAHTPTPCRAAPQPPQKPAAPSYHMMHQTPPLQKSNCKPAQSPPKVPSAKPTPPASKPSLSNTQHALSTPPKPCISASKPPPTASKPLPAASKPLPVASKPLPAGGHPLPVMVRPQAPSRPLPPLTPKTANKPMPPPTPPVKPTASPSPWKSEVSAGQKIALIPPRGGR